MELFRGCGWSSWKAGVFTPKVRRPLPLPSLQCDATLKTKSANVKVTL